MAATVGRNVTMTWGSDSPPQGIAGVKEKSVTIAGEPIDITSDDDSGWRSLLTVPGQKQIDIKISGVTKDHLLLADWFNGNLTQEVILTYPDGAHISGSFYLSEYAEKASYKDAVSFDATLMSTGTIAYSPTA